MIDTREQRPLCLPNSERANLRTGDYSIRVGDRDYRDQIAIERKSLSDLLGVIGCGRDRFERECTRLSMIEYAAMVVESCRPKRSIARNSPQHATPQRGSWFVGAPGQ